MFNIQKMDLLVGVYIFGIIVSELMGAKTFPLVTFGTYTLNASVAIFLLPLLFTINDVVIEVYGAERARSIVRTGLTMIVLLMLFIVLSISLPPSGRFAESEAAYDSVFGKSLRITIASLTAFAVADFLDIAIFSKIRKRMGKSKLWLRNNASNFIAQFIDTALFMTLAFYSLDRGFDENVSFLFSLILPYWLLKCSMSVIETPLVYIGVNWLKKDAKKSKVIVN
ncbi:queuosine precursor transporter [Candidatus Roizmanbacteria bacterium]|nr:MAG: queuosine precursor transporter [Candidatus Roizmanbacteria bacterium]